MGLNEYCDLGLSSRLPQERLRRASDSERERESQKLGMSSLVRSNVIGRLDFILFHTPVDFARTSFQKRSATVVRPAEQGLLSGSLIEIP